MKHLKAILIDLSGTLHVENDIIAGSVEALKKLRQSHLKVRFVTNTTKESKNRLHSQLNRLGLEIHKNEIFTSLTSARQLVEKNKLRPLLFLESEALEDFAVLVVDARKYLFKFKDLDVSNPNAVVMGLAPNKFDYEHLNQAFRLLLNGAQLIAVHKARYFKRKDGLCLGPGAFVSALEYSSNVSSTVVGKPNKQFFLASIEGLGVKPDECVMIGDDVLDDIKGAQEAGMCGILVKTGKYRANDEEQITNLIYLAENFSSAVEFILKNL